MIQNLAQIIDSMILPAKNPEKENERQSHYKALSSGFCGDQ